MPRGQPGLTKSQRRTKCRVTSGRHFVCTIMQRCEAAHWQPSRVQGTHLYICSYIGESIALECASLAASSGKRRRKIICTARRRDN